jgi:hypothetical protein
VLNYLDGNIEETARIKPVVNETVEGVAMRSWPEGGSDNSTVSPELSDIGIKY